MHFSLVKALPEESYASSGCDDVILPLYYALSRLGFSVETRLSGINPYAVNIVFGANLAPGLMENIPADSIIFNLEQFTGSARWTNESYLARLRAFRVWDYSGRNAEFLRRRGVEEVTVLRLGYVPEMTRLAASFTQDVDVLFYGTVNARRRELLDELLAEHLKVAVLRNAHGLERDHAIARAKVLLNIHSYTPSSLEMPRLGYLWANRRAVVSERNIDTEVDAGLEESCCFRSYTELTQAARELVQSAPARERQAEDAFRAFSALRQEDFLEAVLGRKVHGSTLPACPKSLHVGSGKDFRPDCLNVDINPAVNPDLALDISQPLETGRRYPTRRFGDIELRHGYFTRITAFELLAHIPELPALMRNFLDLLEEGGKLFLSVPYDLSLNAWQDPTHVRAFNENSWSYYCEWSWYLGWREARFEVEEMSYDLSEYGTVLAAQGWSGEDLLRAPRAVSGMRVTLRKRRTTPEEHEEFDIRTRSFYTGAVGEWVVR